MTFNLINLSCLVRYITHQTGRVSFATERDIGIALRKVGQDYETVRRIFGDGAVLRGWLAAEEIF